MGDTPPYYILDPRRLLPASATSEWLGRIVTDFRDPRTDFTPSKPQRFTDGLVDEIEATQVRAEISRLGDTSVSAALTQVLNVTKGGGHSTGFSFETGRLKSVRLNNYRNVFRTMRDDAEVRDHLARALRPGGPAAYMVVGLLVWTDATIAVDQGRAKQLGAGAQLPAMAVASAMAGVPLPLEIGNPAVGVSSSDSYQSQLAMSVPGSYIFALEYKAIRRKMYALWPNAKANWDGSGPRGKADRHFNSGDELEEENGREEMLTLDMDEDDSVWYDTVSGLEVDEAELESMILAVERA